MRLCMWSWLHPGWFCAGFRFVVWFDVVSLKLASSSFACAQCVFLTNVLQVFDISHAKTCIKWFRIWHVVWLVKNKTTHHLRLNWHTLLDMWHWGDIETFGFVFENVTWHFEFGVARQMKFIKHTHCLCLSSLIVRILCYLHIQISVYPTHKCIQSTIKRWPPEINKKATFIPMNRENWLLVTDEALEFEKKPVDVQDFKKITDRIRGM